MGYTHYWDRNRELNADDFKAWSNDVQKLHLALPERTETEGGYHSDEPLEIGDMMGKGGEPEFTETLVAFNGIGTWHLESFYMPYSGHGFDFCKTARKPYDLLVTAALVSFKHHFPQESVSSDGDREEWKEGIELCRDVLGYGKFPCAAR